MKQVDLADAKDVPPLYGSVRFKEPTLEAIIELKAGDFVKVCAALERFWVQIVSRDGGRFVCRVDNDLIKTPEHGLYDGDIIRIEARHIIDIYDE